MRRLSSGTGMIRPADLRDVPVILELARASDIAALGEPDWTVEEIVATLTAPNHDPARDSWLALDRHGLAVGWAYLDNPGRTSRDSVEVYVRPGHEAVQPDLLDLAIARVAERAGEAGRPGLTLRAAAIASETAYVETLRAAGFAFIRRHARMRRALTGDERPPEGGPVRPLRADDDRELRRFHEVLSVGFADTPENLPADYALWRATLSDTTWDEWFVATERGRIVGALQSSDQGAENSEGWVKNLAVLPGHRRGGLGRALLAAAFARYAAKGRRFAGLGVDLSNPTGAYRLYTSMGMSPVFEADVYERPVPAR
jgi:ribosomal protein S18 acetylase RimI-like enzyme